MWSGRSRSRCLLIRVALLAMVSGCSVEPPTGLVTVRPDPADIVPTRTFKVPAAAIYDACEVVAQRVDFGQARFDPSDDRNMVKFEPEGQIVLGLYCAIWDTVPNDMVVKWLDVCDPDRGAASFRAAVIAAGLAVPEGCELGLKHVATLQLARLQSRLQQCQNQETLECKGWRAEVSYYARTAAERVRRVSLDRYD
jgi:hypothetical protein